MPEIVVLVGNPRPASRTRDAGVMVAEALVPGGSPTVVELADLGADLMQPNAASFVQAKQTVSSANLLVVSSPTYKATYPGLLKLFLDSFDTASGLEGVTAVPVMLGGSPHHALAPELFLKPLLVELGAATPTPGLFLLADSFAGDGSVEVFGERWRSMVV